MHIEGLPQIFDNHHTTWEVSGILCISEAEKRDSQIRLKQDLNTANPKLTKKQCNFGRRSRNATVFLFQ